MYVVTLDGQNKLVSFIYLTSGVYSDARVFNKYPLVTLPQ